MIRFDPLDRVEFKMAIAADDRFIVTGTDAGDLLHRLSASAVLDLREGDCRHLLFTDDKGALVDAPLAAPTPDGFRMIAGPGRGNAIQDWIRKWIIVDDVHLEPDGQSAWRLGEPDLAAASPDLLRPGTTAGPAVLFGDSSVPEVEPREWEALNFRAGRFYSGPATATGPIPLEIGWRTLIDFDKGCYIGQEVIARMNTYDKIPRGLATAELAAPVPGGTSLSHAGKRCGTVLSSVEINKHHYAWVLVGSRIATGSALVASTQTAGTLVEAPAAWKPS